MTDKTKLVAISRTDDNERSGCTQALAVSPVQYGQKSVKGHECLVCMVRQARSDPLPVTAVDVERYINGLNGSVKMATISHFIACLSSVNSSLGFPDFRNVSDKSTGSGMAGAGE
ncbi:phage integrase family site-specific recombinase (plasmid) [Klebsiella pneumoniae]|nr:phage integrase family site-specific recombinase [Klebsiella pneumoniae]